MPLWLLVYPYKSSASFVTDQAGALCLDVVGNFAALEDNFRDIFSQFGYRREDLTLSRTNATSYVQPHGRLFQLLAALSLRIHAKRDQELFRAVLVDGGTYHARCAPPRYGSATAGD